MEINPRLGTPAPNGKDGVNGLRVQLLVERGLKSGLELVLEVLGHVQERLQRPKIAFWLNVCQKANGKNGAHGPCAQQHVAKGLKSGLELAVEDLGLVQGKEIQRRKFAFSLSVEG